LLAVWLPKGIVELPKRINIFFRYRTTMEWWFRYRTTMEWWLGTE
jgi:hypothetical protein